MTEKRNQTPIEKQNNHRKPSQNCGVKIASITAGENGSLPEIIVGEINEDLDRYRRIIQNGSCLKATIPR